MIEVYLLYFKNSTRRLARDGAACMGERLSISDDPHPPHLKQNKI